jgi:short-subunit dehydrogenase
MPVAPKIAAPGGGSIINVESEVDQIGLASAAAYSATKGVLRIGPGY